MCSLLAGDHPQNGVPVPQNGDHLQIEANPLENGVKVLQNGDIHHVDDEIKNINGNNVL